MEVRPVGVDLFPAYKRTDGHDEANRPFRYFVSAPNKQKIANCVPCVVVYRLCQVFIVL